MTLIPNWRAVLKRGWSVRFLALSLACQAADIVLSARGAFADDPDVRVQLQLAGLAAAGAGMAARFVYQWRVHDAP